MSNKRLKLAHGLINFTPVAVSFDDLETEFEDGTLAFSPSDGGLQQKRLEDNIEYEEMVAQILCNLEDREKLIFLYELLRDSGYQIDYAAFAKTLNPPLTLRAYMKALATLRQKTVLFIRGFQMIKTRQGS
jgi:hypothetical protein